MAQNSMIRHGSDRGYREEIKRGEPCSRCRNAHRVYQTQFRAKGKAAGLSYAADQVIDQLYSARRAEPSRNKSRATVGADHVLPAEPFAEPSVTGPGEPSGAEQGPSAPGLGDRLSAALGKLRLPDSETGNPYVEADDIPDYLHESIPDPEPEGFDSDWSEVSNEEYIINAAGMRKIEENLGTYLSVIGMTAEMLDPYCGSVLASNFDNIVSKWSKVIGNYPKAAQLFLDGKSGVVFTWIGAIQATWPVLFAIYQHHLAKNIQVRPDGRIFQRQSTDANGYAPGYDGMTPPMPGQNTADAFKYTAN